MNSLPLHIEIANNITGKFMFHNPNDTTNKLNDILFDLAERGAMDKLIETESVVYACTNKHYNFRLIGEVNYMPNGCSHQHEFLAIHSTIKRDIITNEVIITLTIYIYDVSEVENEDHNTSQMFIGEGFEIFSKKEKYVDEITVQNVIITTENKDFLFDGEDFAVLSTDIDKGTIKGGYGHTTRTHDITREHCIEGLPYEDGKFYILTHKVNENDLLSLKTGTTTKFIPVKVVSRLPENKTIISVLSFDISAIKKSTTFLGMEINILTSEFLNDGNYTYKAKGSNLNFNGINNEIEKEVNNLIAKGVPDKTIKQLMDYHAKQFMTNNKVLLNKLGIKG